jgi:hypothetical protein
LLLAKRIAVEEGKKKLVNLVSAKRVGEPVIDECLEKIGAAKRRAAVQTWVARFAQLRGLKHRVALGLCQRNILRVDQDKVLLIFRRKIYPEINPTPERQLIERLRKAVFTDARRVDGRTAILVSLANAADLLKIPFDKKELKRRKDHIERIANGDLMGKATKDAVQAAQAAVMVACIMPAVTTTVITS